MTAAHIRSMGLALLLSSGIAFGAPSEPMQPTLPDQVMPVSPVSPVSPVMPVSQVQPIALDDAPGGGAPVHDTDAVRQTIRDEVSAAVARELAEIDTLRAEVERLRLERDALMDLDSDTVIEKVVAEQVRRHGWHGRDEAVGFGSPVIIEAGMTVEEAASLGDDVQVYGTVTGDAISFGGDVIVRAGGKVMGDATSLGGVVRIEEGGQILGDADHLGGAVVVEPGGQVQAAAINRIRPHQTTWIAAFFYSLYQKLVFLLAFAGAGVLITALFPERVARVADALREHPLKSGVTGLAGTIGLLVVSVLFFWTVIGPIVLIALLGVAWMIGFVGLCQFLGDRLPFSYKPHGRWLAFLMGSVILSFVGALPWIGIVTVLGASFFGIGAAFVSRMGSR